MNPIKIRADNYLGINMPCWLPFLAILMLVITSAITKPVLAETQQIAEKLSDIAALSDKNTAIAELQVLLELPSNTPNQQVIVLTEIGNSYHALEEFSKAINSFEQVLVLAKANNLKMIAADASKAIGIFHYFKGTNLQAVEAYQTALDYYLTLDEPIKQANLLNNIGLSYDALGELQLSLESYQQASKLYQQYGSEVDLVDIRFNIAGLYLSLKKYQDAINILKPLRQKKIDFGDHKGTAHTNNHLGIAYKHLQQFEQAQYYTRQALQYYQEHNLDYFIIREMANLASVYNLSSQPEKAISYAEQAIALNIYVDNNQVRANAFHELAQGYFLLGKIDLAITALNKSNSIAEQTQSKPLLTENQGLYSLIYAAQHQHNQAAAAHKAYQVRVIQANSDELKQEQARFEAEQLNLQIQQLQQNEKLSQLQTEQAEQQRQFALVAIAFTLLILFIIYRRMKERETQRDLETKVKQRTAELELVAEQLTHANQVKGQFLANMSHEIRTPLTAIIGQSEAIIHDEIEPQSLTKEVQIIHDNSLHLLKLVNDILDLSKIEANKLELETQEYDLNQSLVELANMFTQQAKNKGLVFEINHHLAYPFIISVDRLRLNQILINFCSNAIKFTKHGRVSLNIVIEANQLHFKVIDTGIGMNESQIREVFDCFTQADNTISRRFGGTGLGLFLSAQLAEVMGGDIEVESTLGKGSSFTFIFPLAAVKPSVGITSPADNNTKDQYNKLFSGQILVADDHPDNLRLIERLLTNLGLEVFSAINGKQAIELYLQHQPQLILLDIQMPEMDGIIAMQKMREQGCKQAIYALTANAMDYEIKNYLAIGFDGHLNKPLERSKFIATIAKYYDAKVATSEALNSVNAVDLSDLISEFKANLSNEKQQLEDHLQNRDFVKLKNQAHRLAGAAAMFGFQKITTMATNLEAQMNADNVVLTSQLTQLLLTELELTQ